MDSSQTQSLNPSQNPSSKNIANEGKRAQHLQQEYSELLSELTHHHTSKATLVAPQVSQQKKMKQQETMPPALSSSMEHALLSDSNLRKNKGGGGNYFSNHYDLKRFLKNPADIVREAAKGKNQQVYGANVSTSSQADLRQSQIQQQAQLEASCSVPSSLLAQPAAKKITTRSKGMKKVFSAGSLAKLDDEQLHREIEVRVRAERFLQKIKRIGARLKPDQTRRDLSHHLDVQRNLQQLLKQKELAERQPLPTTLGYLPNALQPMTPGNSKNFNGLTVLEQIIERPTPRVLPQVLVHDSQVRRFENHRKSSLISDNSELPRRDSSQPGAFHLPTDLQEIEAQLQQRQNERADDLLSAEMSIMRQSSGQPATDYLTCDIFSAAMHQNDKSEQHRERIRKMADRSMKDIQSNVELLLGQGRDFFGTDAFFKKDQHKRLFGGPLRLANLKHASSVARLKAQQLMNFSPSQSNSRDQRQGSFDYFLSPVT